MSKHGSAEKQVSFAQDQRALTPTARANRIQKEFNELVEELHDGTEFKLISESLRLMHEEQLCSELAQQ